MALGTGRRVLLEEAESLRRLADGLGEAFEKAAEWLLRCEGRVVCCGVGKSGHVARKAAGTFASTGTPSLFLHAAEAMHGDLGMIRPEDVLLLYTHSGESDEIVRLFPSVRAIGARTVLMTGRPDSSAGRLADLVLDTCVEREACPHDLAPTTSTTAMMALGDALAIAVMDARGFTREDFARFHPSGTLGRRLLLHVSDVMKPLGEIPAVGPSTPVLDVMRGITKAGVGAACVVEGTRLVGIISDGDLRRHFLSGSGGLEATAESMMTHNPAAIPLDLLAAEALEVFQNLPKKVGEMPVVQGGELKGLLALKDLLRAGIV
ncbi:MAG: KpsF/GutQ family sugar-phosphate isomerase [Fimbriimonas ginsengisoli]|uniref:KpsF/GutQ family sugar-phosphate isomerase n=1 Tax=Fimbriimonas ginsengisoli TaxID=1005039 RepID=A0A931LRV4_FIMGI|nr:KpsF/GutQ family sugar-phosphate isomerase [Fimbriimonas ginsengisoli]